MALWLLQRGSHFSTVIAVTCLVTLSQGDVGDEGMSGRPLRREKRGWVWNQFFVLEEYAEDKPLYIGKLHSDLDNGDGSVKYILSGEGAGTTFTLDESTGDIHAVQRLDREMKDHYILRAQVTHRRTGQALEPESRFIVKIQDINDNEPKFPDGPYKATVPEMSPVGTSVIRVTATDADDPSYGNSARVVYSVVKGQPYFSVDRHTGEVRVSLPDMDREVKGQYEVVIEAKDMAGQLGGLTTSTTINVTLSDVNDNPPRFAQKVYQMSIPESAPVGSVVGHVEAWDQDLGINAETRYRVIDGKGRDAFDVGADSTNTYGVITVKQRLDYETARSYAIKVEAANAHVDKRFSVNGPFSDMTMVQVNIEDVDEPPQFGSTLYYAEVREDAEIGTALVTVSARDPDAANNSIRYMIDRASDPDQYFSVGVVSGSLMTVLRLDRENIGWHNLTVIATETDNPLRTASVSVAIRVLDVNDNPPIANHRDAFLCDSARAGQLVQSIRAVDADEPIGGQHFRYSLAPEARTNPNFTLIDNHDNSARVLTRRGGWVAQSVYHLPITVSDGGEPVLSSTHTLTIRVCECDADGDVSSCRNAEPHMLPANLSMAALTTMLACGSVMLALFVLILLVSSGTKKPFLSGEEENVRENIVHYDDEGGGEEDTVAFDMTKLWKTHAETLSYAELVFNGTKQRHANDKDIKPHNFLLRQEKQNEIPSLSCYVTQKDAKKTSANANTCNIYSCMLAKLCEADLDVGAAAYDSLQTFAYEGEGSVAESLSSLQSNDDLELDYDYLDEWGPRFHTLAELYGRSQSTV